MTTLVVVPSRAAPGETVDVDGAGFDTKVKFSLTTVDALGVEVGQATNTNRPRRDGTFGVGINVPSVVGSCKVRAYQRGVRVAEAAVTVAAAPPVITPVASGIPMPTSEPVGFRRVFADDFLQAVPEGQFPAATGGRWAAYNVARSPLPAWANGNGYGWYDPSIVSVHDSVMDIRLYTDSAGVIHIANPSPLWTPQVGRDEGQYQTYGRYSVCCKADSLVGFKWAQLLWGNNDANYVNLGEIDWPEGGLNGAASAFLHPWGGGQQFAYPTSARLSDWHVYTVEWKPGSVEFFLDGVSVGRSTVGVPQGPMRWQLQTETVLKNEGPKPLPTVAGHALFDWVTVGAYAG